MSLLYEQETYKIIGAAMQVHNELGFGFLEAVYQEALQFEFEMQEIPVRREVPLQIFYKERLISKFYIADFICFDKIIVEIKSVTALHNEHTAQVINYLKATGYELGLLINFGTKSLEHKRVISDNPRKSVKSVVKKEIL
jgi:GxxExxY protein